MACLRDEFTRQGANKVRPEVKHFACFYDDLRIGLADSGTLLEIGVQGGGSLGAWRYWLPAAWRVVGLDDDRRCADLQIRGVDVVIGSQSCLETLAFLVEKYAPFACVVDDGSHRADDQWASFAALWPHVQTGGWYVIEDLHTAYWSGFTATAGGIVDRVFAPALHASQAWALTQFDREPSGVAIPGEVSDVAEVRMQQGIGALRHA